MPIKRLVLAEIDQQLYPMLLEYDTNNFEEINAIYEYSPLHIETETHQLIFFDEYFIDRGYQDNPPKRVLFADMGSRIDIQYIDPQDGSIISSYLEVGEFISYNSSLEGAQHPYPEPDSDNPAAVMHTGFNPLQQETTEYNYVLNKYKLVKPLMDEKNFSPTQQIDNLIARAQEQDARLKGKAYDPVAAATPQSPPNGQTIVPTGYIEQIQYDNHALMGQLLQQQHHAEQVIAQISFAAQQRTQMLEYGIKNSQVRLNNTQLAENILRFQLTKQQDYVEKLAMRKRAAEHQLRQQKSRANMLENELAKDKREKEARAKEALEQQKLAEEAVAKSKAAAEKLKRQLEEEQRRAAKIRTEKEITEKELAKKSKIEKSLEQEKLCAEQFLADKKQAEQLLREAIKPKAESPIVAPTNNSPQKSTDKKPKQRKDKKTKAKIFAREQEDAWNDDKLFAEAAAAISPSQSTASAPILTSWDERQKKEPEITPPPEPIELEFELDHGYFSLKTKLRLCAIFIHYYVFLYNNVDLINNKSRSEKMSDDLSLLLMSIIEAQVISETFNYVVRYLLEQSLKAQARDIIHGLKDNEKPSAVRLKNIN